MEKPKMMCRICLTTDVRMYFIGQRLREIFKAIADIPFESEVCRPMQICYICHARLQNCHQLRVQCRQTEELLRQMLNDDKLLLQGSYGRSKLEIAHPVVHVNLEGEVAPQTPLMYCEIKMEHLDSEEDVVDLSNEPLMLKDRVSVEVIKSEMEEETSVTQPAKNVEGAISNSNDDRITETDKNKDNLSFKKQSGNKKTFKCEICTKWFCGRSNLTRHMRIHTGEKRYQCDVCKKGFAEKSDLKIHSRRHVGEKPYQCDVCLIRFCSSSNHITHMRLHVNEKRFQCDVCEKSFSQKNHLKIHTRTHTGEKPYQCDVCEKCFSDKSSIINHMRLHFNQKPFKCKLCDKRFILNFQLKNHLFIHSGEKRYVCKICNRNFNHSSSLRRHKKRKH